MAQFGIGRMQRQAEHLHVSYLWRMNHIDDIDQQPAGLLGYIQAGADIDH